MSHLYFSNIQLRPKFKNLVVLTVMYRYEKRTKMNILKDVWKNSSEYIYVWRREGMLRILSNKDIHIFTYLLIIE